jgi:hypothetical protein
MAGGRVVKNVYVPLAYLDVLDRAVERSGIGYSPYMLAAAMKQAWRDNAKADSASDEQLADVEQADELSRAAGL